MVRARKMKNPIKCLKCPHQMAALVQ
uniref:Uncharacterized protein n=1 Tax=Arundo donax TaxID=35708 RepID=A0A0A9H724_ARUDO